MKPTPEQVAGALAYFASDPRIASVLQYEFGSVGLGHFRTLLVATEPPTDEELNAEAVAFLASMRADGPCNNARIRTAYIAGARREGRR